MNAIISNKTVIVIHDGRKGHLNPSLAVAEIVQEKYALGFHAFQLPMSMSKKWVSLFKKLSNFPIFYKIFGQLFFKAEPANIQQAEMIICSGMPNLIYAAYLSQKFHLPLLYVGNLRKFNEKLIDLSITALPQNVNCKQIILPTPPVSANFTTQYNLPKQHNAVLLLGGSTTEYPFSKQNFADMIQQFTHFISTHQLKGSVICSRRTPNLDTKSLDLLHIQQIEYIDQHQKVTMSEKLAQCKYIFVTEDSITMLSEAIHTGAVVTAICLNEAKTDELIEKYLNYQYIQRKSITHLGQIIEHYSPIKRTDMLIPLVQQLDRLYFQGHFHKTTNSRKKNKVYA
ncbi:ELM1/GtrOC1 family putative glycosyltransferase [Acinetobacter sp. Marseille-Q1618]|uniref:ELM1/GtrOC1 family putative glycosyltransferase n=1 Tax=Acinetobacter sp. Marseille-Q1618 TaxID=2697502 RepID=UPI00156F7A5B|nr:ELM1/GtrOC1 family putative glycosyltransferase [Acinetobacter sp. Marseille-Q1618]